MNKRIMGIFAMLAASACSPDTSKTKLIVPSYRQSEVQVALAKASAFSGAMVMVTAPCADETKTHRDYFGRIVEVNDWSQQGVLGAAEKEINESMRAQTPPCNFVNHAYLKILGKNPNDKLGSSPRETEIDIDFWSGEARNRLMVADIGAQYPEYAQ